jgi:integrase
VGDFIALFLWFTSRALEPRDQSWRSRIARTPGDLAHRHAPPIARFTTVRKSTRLPKRELRTREHLTEKEVYRLIKAVGDNRYGRRDATMVLIAFRHGLPASELCDLRWDQVDLTRAILHVRRAKNGTPSTHPLTGREMRALRRLQAIPVVYKPTSGTDTSSTRCAIQSFRQMV